MKNNFYLSQNLNWRILLTLGTSVSKYDKTTMPIEVIEVEASTLDDIVAEIKIKYHTFLLKGVQKGKHVT